MSTALASARRRRAGPETTGPVPGVRQTTTQPSFPGASQQNMGVGLTLPQVIAVVDKRLMTLETFMQNQTSENARTGPMQMSPSQTELPENFKDILDEYASRFDIIADELASMKDTIMKLQTYTMEVNKTLMEDRIRILSDEPTPLENALNNV
jgi:hypothetical protein